MSRKNIPFLTRKNKGKTVEEIFVQAEETLSQAEETFHFSLNLHSTMKGLLVFGNFAKIPEKFHFVSLFVDDDRIVGGYTADSNKPWIAKLWLVKGEFLCGSSIINKRLTYIYYQS